MTSTESTDAPICGYQRADGTLCLTPRTGSRCDEHGNTRFAVCSGCSEAAFRECPHEFPGGEKCRSALCMSCSHTPDDQHGPLPDMTPRQEPREIPDGLKGLREELIKTMQRALTEVKDKNMITFTGEATSERVAAELVDRLATHTALMSLSAAAMAVPS